MTREPGHPEYFGGFDADIVQSIAGMHEKLWCLWDSGQEQLNPAPPVPSLDYMAVVERIRGNGDDGYLSSPAFDFGGVPFRMADRYTAPTLFGLPVIEHEMRGMGVVDGFLVPHSLTEEIIRDLQRASDAYWEQECARFSPTGFRIDTERLETWTRDPQPKSNWRDWRDRLTSRALLARERLARRIYEFISRQDFPDEEEEDW